MDHNFYVLRKEGLIRNSLVSHISFSCFACIVTTTGDWLRAMVFTYDQAVAIRDYLQGHENECRGYTILSLPDL